MEISNIQKMQGRLVSLIEEHKELNRRTDAGENDSALKKKKCRLKRCVETMSGYLDRAQAAISCGRAMPELTPAEAECNKLAKSIRLTGGFPSPKSPPKLSVVSPIKRPEHFPSTPIPQFEQMG